MARFIVALHNTGKSAGPAEVAASFGVGWYVDHSNGYTLGFSLPLVVPKEEKFIFHDGAADGSTILVARKCSQRRRKIVPRIKRLVAQEIETRPVNIVGAALGNHVDDGAGGMSVFRVKGIGQQSEFLNGIENGNDGSAIIDNFLGRGPIDHKLVSRLLHAVDREIPYVAQAVRGFGKIELALPRTNGHHAGLQAEQIDVTSSIEGQGGDLGVLDDVANLIARRLYLNRLPLHIHRLRNAAHVEPEVGPVALVHQKLLCLTG